MTKPKDDKFSSIYAMVDISNNYTDFPLTVGAVMRHDYTCMLCKADMIVRSRVNWEHNCVFESHQCPECDLKFKRLYSVH